MVDYYLFIVAGYCLRKHLQLLFSNGKLHGAGGGMVLEIGGIIPELLNMQNFVYKLLCVSAFALITPLEM